MDKCKTERRSLAEEFQTLQSFFVALGDENRQQIFITLLGHEAVGMRVPEITSRTHLSRPAVSHHQRILREAGLIDVHHVGTMNYYYVSAGVDKWAHIKQLVDHVCQVAQEAAQSHYPHFDD